jgi:hypothetical protein
MPEIVVGLRAALEHLIYSTHGYKPDACSGCSGARAALASLSEAEAGAETFNRLGSHLYTDRDRVAIEAVQTKLPRPWSRVLVLPSPAAEKNAAASAAMEE